MPPATGSMRIYSDAYNSVKMVPRFGGRFGIMSQVGIGSRDGVLVPWTRAISMLKQQRLRTEMTYQ